MARDVSGVLGQGGSFFLNYIRGNEEGSVSPSFTTTYFSPRLICSTRLRLVKKYFKKKYRDQYKWHFEMWKADELDKDAVIAAWDEFKHLRDLQS
jgi:hypothetical protein